MVETINRLARRVSFQNPTPRNQIFQCLSSEAFVSTWFGNPPIDHAFPGVLRVGMANEVIENTAPDNRILCFHPDRPPETPHTPPRSSSLSKSSAIRENPFCWLLQAIQVNAIGWRGIHAAAV